MKSCGLDIYKGYLSSTWCISFDIYKGYLSSTCCISFDIYKGYLGTGYTHAYNVEPITYIPADPHKNDRPVS
jgi:general stress protein CsbA